MLAQKEGPLAGTKRAEPQREGILGTTVTRSGTSCKESSSCLRCKRKLTNAHSIARSLGPVCYRKSGGGIFDGDMRATENQWEQRADDLRRSGVEWDFGYWDSVWRTEHGMMFLPHALRVSVRFRDGAFEAYGVRFLPDSRTEVLFYRGDDIKECWRAAIAAGPESNAAAYRIQHEIARGGGRRG